MSAQPLPAAQTIDLPAALNFLEKRFGHIHTGYAVLCFIKDDTLSHEYVSLQSPDRWERARLIIERYADTHDCYLAAAVFKETKRWNPATKKYAYRTTEMIAFVTALYIERDDHPYPDTLPPPSYTVKTSEGRYHDYFILDKPTDAETAGRYLRRLAAACGIGTEAVDAARLLRLVGTINRKAERAGETVRVIAETDAVYTLADFDYLPDVAPIPTKGGTPANGGKVRFVPGERRPALLRIAGAMRRVGADEDAIRAALEQANAAQCDPPLDDDEVQALARDIAARYAPAPPEPVRVDHRQEPTPLRPNRVDPETGEVLERRALTDYGNAERLVQHHGADLRFCHPFNKWLAWDGSRWQIDNTAEVMRRAKQTARRIYQEAADASDPAKAKELVKHAMRSESDARLRAMIGLAESEPGVPVLPDQLDADPWLFNVENGTIDLKTGGLLPHDRGALITKIAPVTHDPSATCPTFDAFLARILPSEPLRKFVQRAIGHSLTGDTREDVIFIGHGKGANGKTTFMQAMQSVMGDYAMQTPTETLMVKRGEGVPNDVAALKGSRLVAAAEAEEGKRLAESLIKQLTGGDRISARFMRAEWFSFEPTFKIWLLTNHKPIIRGTDLGIWRRIRLIPFTVTIPEPERDATLAEKLRDELPGILNWTLAGCRDWLENGLGQPEEVQQATKGYREEMDVLGNWLRDCCIEGDNYQATSTDLYASYKHWCENSGIRFVMTQIVLGGRLSERGFESARGHGGKRYWRGIGLLFPDGTPPLKQAPFDSGDAGDTGDTNSSIPARENNTNGLCPNLRHPVSPVSPATDELLWTWVCDVHAGRAADTPEDVRQAAQQAGFAFDAFAPIEQEADRLGQHLDDREAGR